MTSKEAMSVSVTEGALINTNILFNIAEQDLTPLASRRFTLVVLEGDLDLSEGAFKCNCEMCIKTRLWGAIVPPHAFRLLSGEADLKDYQPDSIHHLFCRHCGARPFAWGENPALGGKFYAVRVYCLENVDVEELINAPITCFDGRNDNYESPPRETRHLQRRLRSVRRARPRSLQESRSLRRGKNCPDEDSSFVEEVNKRNIWN